ncbi:hypothetical protein J4G33_15120 [Actinotalea sp. BY-33]|uniref:Lipoprotein n=1 Tax=Actinotalea soli TaxID=2819234 RepID=A0A939LUC4_9CELL|nr:hypothetical protein [Actinotalea soli]MBO1753140.1 hypothetical protein [Actinotalea soli]
MGARIGRMAALAAAVLVLAACAPGANELVGTAIPGTTSPAGFWRGLWHGVIAPVTFVVSLFSDGVGIYEVHNNGGWYDAGFLLGLSAVFGGGAGSSQATRTARRRRT